MPVTMARINLVHGVGPVMQLAEGYTCQLSKKVHDILDKRTDPTWPTTWFAPKLTGEGAFTDVYSVMSNWGAKMCIRDSPSALHFLASRHLKTPEY